MLEGIEPACSCNGFRLPNSLRKTISNTDCGTVTNGNER